MSILTRVQLNPEIGTANETYVTDLIQRVKDFIVGYCNLCSFPELSRGYSKGHTGAFTNISTVNTDSFLLSVNGSDFRTITINKALCITGAATASELQTAIRAVTADGFDEVEVSFNSDATQYTITSGRYGTDSSIKVAFHEDSKHIALRLRLSPAFGGTEVAGNVFSQSIEDLAVTLVEMKYRKLGLEGLSNGSIPGGMSFTAQDIPADMQTQLLAHRRL